MHQSRLLADTVEFAPTQHLLFLNSAANPFVMLAVQQLSAGSIVLAEDNIAALHTAIKEARGGALATASTASTANLRHIAFHVYTLREPAATMDVAIMDLLYQPNNAWIIHGLQLAAYALKPGGRLYVVGAKERGILTIAKRMQALFGNVETLTISKGHRVVSSRSSLRSPPHKWGVYFENMLSNEAIFAQGKLDEGTSLLLEVLGMPLVVQPADEALDIGCGAGYLGLHIARLATKGRVTMVDVSLLSVAMAQRTIDSAGLTNICVLPSDGAQAVLEQRFDLVVTNPPFHHGGLQTTATAERFIRQASQVLRPHGRFYLVANRFLKYEPTLHSSFNMVEEVGGNTRFKVLRAMLPIKRP